MKIEEVRKLSPQDRVLYWIQERENIRIKKIVGSSKPWTDDYILQNFRFCNCKRMDDKVSQWLLNHWYEPNFNHVNMVLACVIARHFNKPDTLSHIGFPYIWNPKSIIERLNELKASKRKIFNSAYIIRAEGKGSDKILTTINHTCQQFVDKPLDVDRDSMRNTINRLMKYRGIGSFMAGQICADLRWAIQGTWSDKDVYAPIGPGSERGMNRLLGLPTNKPMTQAEFEINLMKMMEVCIANLPTTITDRLEAIDYQSLLCELDKYTRILLNEGKPKQRYNGVK